ncbi:origin recognition complex subunit 5 [Orussus abietinus]|uniref:origin recognition complex subunit 5 n=1 Tax=Orussus abietinus TaxID=222816 RepID=UPI000C715E70|nr:origin recognition complex subunit 5 [Orussus abietinus]
MSSDMEKYLVELGSKILCRNNVLKQLYYLIGNKDEPKPESIFLYGHVSTGKSFVIENLLSYLKYNHSIINCIEYQTSKRIFEYILVDLSSHKLSSEDNFAVYKKCDNFLDFILQLKDIVGSNGDPVIIVFDKCERMRDMDPNLLPAFLRLKELSGINVCTIFVSDIVWEKFHSKTGMLEPIKVYLPQYTRDEMAKILFLNKPQSNDDSFYKNYINLFLSVFFRFCRDVNELRYMAMINFKKYVEPVESGQLDSNDVSALWRNISSILKKNLEVIYLRVSTDDFQDRAQLSVEIESTTKLALSFELPFYAKYLLIAAFLASYNPAKEDKRLFLKQSSKRKKRIPTNKKPIIARMSSGPRQFPLTRMLAIFCAIIDEKVDLNASLLAQIPTMCKLGLLAEIGDNNLDEPKFRCCAGYDFILVISKTVGFSISNYLYDLIH